MHSSGLCEKSHTNTKEGTAGQLNLRLLMLNMSNLIYNNVSSSVLGNNVNTKQGDNIFGSVFNVKLVHLGTGNG